MPSYEEALRGVTDVLRAHAKIERAIKPTDNIQNDLALDSLAVMEVVAEVEDKFHVDIPSEMLDHMFTVEDVARALVELTAVTPAAPPL